MRRRASLLAALLCLGAPVGALDLSFPTGSRQLMENVSAPGSYAMPIAPYADGALQTTLLEGRVHRETWQISRPGVTNLQILRPMREAVLDAGYDILLDCADQICGGFDFRFATEVLPAPNMFVDLSDFRFLSARSAASAVSILVSGTQSTRLVQIIRVSEAEEAMAVSEASTTTSPTPPRTTRPSAPTLPVMLEGAGRIILEDLAFETGSATLTEEPYDVLERLAEYLRSNPGRRIALVGHTDAVGNLDINISISRSRANAVRERLANAHDVPRDQMEAGGMGYLAPRASNLTPAGRALNRRVEAVLISTE